METALVLVFVLITLALATITALKGKWGVLALGLVVWAAWLLGSIRLARPGSYWSRRFYDDAKQQRAQRVAPFRRRLAIAGAVASVLVVGALFGLLETYRITSSAMEPAAEASDRVLARRYVFSKEPSRGDVVAFRTPQEAQERCGAGGVYVKRVVGLPGERWALRSGAVYIDGRRLDEPYVPDDRRGRDTHPAEAIPMDAYLVLGDNRAQSCDSRVWGPLPRSSLIGEVILRYWPLSRLGTP